MNNPLVINQSQKKVFEEAGIDTSGMVLNKPMPMTSEELILCDICNTMKHPAHQYDGLEICARCWPEYAEENDLCPTCGSELEVIWENNGFQAPDPTHYEITGYKPCGQCAYKEE